MRLIYKIFYQMYRWGSGLRYWAWRRFTVAGLCVAGGFIVTASVGTNIDATVTYQSFGLLLAVLVFAISNSFLFRGRFSATRFLPRFGTAGRPLTYSVTVKNLTSRPQTGLVLFENLADMRPSFNDWVAFQLAESRRVKPFRISGRRRANPFRIVTVKESAIPPLPPKGEVEVRVELLPLRRGILRFTGVTVGRSDPLGIFRGFAKAAAVQSVSILPKRYPLPPIALPGSMKYQEGGVALASNVGRSEEFVSLRDYRRGDPIRHIHWRSWAKAGKPIVKEFEDEFFVRHALVLDTFTTDPQSEVLEEAISVAASFACTVLTQESLLDLLFVGAESYCFTAGRGLAHADQMLEILASVQPCTAKTFAALDTMVIAHVSVVSGCICVLQRWDEARKRFVEKLRAVGVPTMVFVIVRHGEKVEAGPGMDENFHVLEIGKIEEQLAVLR